MRVHGTTFSVMKARIPSQIFQSSVSAFPGVEGIPVTGQLSCQLLQFVALLLLVLLHPAPARTLGMMTLPLTR